MKKLAIGMMVVCSLMAVSGAAWCGDNMNGTVTLAGLVWLKNPNCWGKMNWDSAVAKTQSLASGQCDLTDNSKPGDWRLPTKEELGIIFPDRHRFKNFPGGNYWSSSTYGIYIWVMVMSEGVPGLYGGSKTKFNYVWPVRSVQ